MSSPWINDAGAVPNHNGNGFPNLADPNLAGAMMDPAAFMANAAGFNSQAAPQFANPQQIAAMQNGPMRNASPPFSQPVYQTNSVIPSKRPRPREDSLASSPRQNPAMLPTSRAETPQQSPYPPNFAPGAVGQNAAAHASQYPHMGANGTPGASPSPGLPNQMRAGSVPQRVSTASPFSPGAQQFAPQASPLPPDVAGNTPQNPYMQGNFPPNFNQNFTPSPSPSRPSPMPNAMGPGQMMPSQMGLPPQMMQQVRNQMMAQMPQGANQDQQRMMYMRLQQQIQAQHQQQQQQGGVQMGSPMPGQQQQPQQQQVPPHMSPGGAMMGKPGGPMPNGHMPPGGMRPQQPQPPRNLPNAESFLKNLTHFMASKQLPLDTNPTIADRPLNLAILFQTVQKAGSYHNVTAQNRWPNVAMQLGINPMQVQQAPQQLKQQFERNLLEFEKAYIMSRQATLQNQAGSPIPPGPNTPTKPMTPQQMQQNQAAALQQAQQRAMQAGQQPPQTPSKQMPPGPQQQQPAVNGFATPQPPHLQHQQQQQQQHQQIGPVPGHKRNSMSQRSVDGTPVGAPDMQSMPSPTAARKQSGAMPMPMEGHPAPGPDGHVDGGLPFTGPLRQNPEEYIPMVREVAFNFGGVDLQTLSKIGYDLERVKPDFPRVMELGTVDIHALTKSIQSGLHAEVRVALDTLAAVTVSDYAYLQMNLQYCEDLVESLIDCAEEQLERLAVASAEESDEILVTPYEDLVRECHVEKHKLRKVPEFGTAEYELDRAVDKLICVTTILRNLSWLPDNLEPIADEMVIKFICTAIRYLGTRTMVLRTARDTLDFMKDLINIISNMSAAVVLSDREEVFYLLHFLLAFAPSPLPNLGSDERVYFSRFEPSQQPYYPIAVDALAKLLARDEPNRTLFAALFADEPPDLLTKAFALAIAAVPERVEERQTNIFLTQVDHRKPCVMQGLLAADILASLAPSWETGVTRAWLDGGASSLAPSLLFLVRAIARHVDHSTAQRQRAGAGPQQPGQERARRDRDADFAYMATLAVSTLKRLAEKARDPADPTSEFGIPPGALPTRETVLELFQMRFEEWKTRGMLADMLAYAALED